MEHLEDVFRKKGKIYDGSARMVNDLFKASVYEGDEETAKALIFQNSPVISAVNYIHNKETFLQMISRIGRSIAIAELLLKFGANIDVQNTCGDTALHLNSYYDGTNKTSCLNMVKFLLNNGANRDIRNRNGLTPIQLNLFRGNLEIAEEFLEEEDKLPNINELDRITRRRHLVKCLLQENKNCHNPLTNYSFLLHFLLLEDDEEAFDNVVNNSKFDVNAISHTGFSLLHLAAYRDGVQMAKTLIKAGADVNVEGLSMETPLITAIKKTRLELFHLLIESGASINKIQINQTEMNSPLHYAVCVQSFEMVKTLVNLGAKVNILTYHRSPLLLACGSIDSKKWPSTTGAVSSSFYLKTVFYSNRLFEFAFNVKIVECLLDNGADIGAKNVSNRTALDQACHLGQLDIVKLLLNRGAKINQGGVSTLHYAVKGENPAVVKLILEQGANVNYRCAPEKMISPRLRYVRPPPRTPLECALDLISRDSKCKDVIEVLIKYGVDINAVEPIREETALHLACLSNKKFLFETHNARSRTATIALLLKSNADVNALDAEGMVPLYYALRNYTNEIEEDTTDDEDFDYRFKEDLVTLVAFIAKKIEAKDYVVKENLVLLEDEAARSIYQDCMKELSLMKKNICESRKMSFFNILSRDIDRLGYTLKNEDILQVLSRGEYKTIFPIYAEYIEGRIKEALIRQRLVDLGIGFFQKYVNKIFNDPLVNIFKYLNLNDLQTLEKACFVDFEGK